MEESLHTTLFSFSSLTDITTLLASLNNTVKGMLPALSLLQVIVPDVGATVGEPPAPVADIT